MRRVVVKNIYGYPSLSATFLEWAKSIGVDLVVGNHNIEKKLQSRRHGFIIVVSGLGFLESAGIPVIGFQRLSNATYNRYPLPSSLIHNKATLQIAPFTDKLPPSKELYDVIVKNAPVPEDWPARIKSTHQGEPLCQAFRVFK